MIKYPNQKYLQIRLQLKIRNMSEPSIIYRILKISSNTITAKDS